MCRISADDNNLFKMLDCEPSWPNQTNERDWQDDKRTKWSEEIGAGQSSE